VLDIYQDPPIMLPDVYDGTMIVMAGKISRDAEGLEEQTRLPIEAIVHPKYKHVEGTQYFDIAIIKLNESFTYNRYIQPILPVKPRVNVIGSLFFSVKFY
jgi:hypothetical protein